MNSKKKGNRVELELTKILTSHFNRPFSRSVGSGARGWQVANLPSHAKTTLTGDICPPEGFKWVIECKGGYEDKIDLNGITEGIAQLDEFVKQSTHDAKEGNRKPIIVWKRSRKPWLAMVRDEDMASTPASDTQVPKEETSFLYYKGWFIVDLQTLLKNTKIDFWFEEQKSDTGN